MRNEFCRFLLEKVKAGKGKDVVLVTGDLGYSVLEPLAEELGKRFLNCGVAEASMMSVSAALAARGMKVFACSIVPFATLRCLEQIRNDICYHGLDVTVVGVGAGYGYGTLGPSHHSTEDIAAMWSLPHMSVFSPGDVRETRECLNRSFDRPGPKYLRLGKGGEGVVGTHFPLNTDGDVFEYGEGRGRELTLITTGPVLGEVFKAAQAADPPGNRLQLLSCPFLKPFPTEKLLSVIRSRRVLVIDETNPYGGFSAQVSRALLEGSGGRWESVKTVSAPDGFAKKVGDATYLRQWAGLDAAAVGRQIAEMLLPLARAA